MQMVQETPEADSFTFVTSSTRVGHSCSSQNTRHCPMDLMLFQVQTVAMQLLSYKYPQVTILVGKKDLYADDA